MQYTFHCDNCGKEIVTDCFIKHENHITYYTPAITQDMKPGERVVAMATRAMTTLCITCITQ